MTRYGDASSSQRTGEWNQGQAEGSRAAAQRGSGAPHPTCRSFHAGKMKKEAEGLQYNKDLVVDIETSTQQAPRALVHSREWLKIMNGECKQLVHRSCAARARACARDPARCCQDSVPRAVVAAGEPVQINPSIGDGYKVMTFDEWSANWKRNDDFPDCLCCGSKNTKEHHFVQI